MENSEKSLKYEEIKRGIVSLGYVRPGSLVRRFMPCGKPGCRCMAEKPKLHGPYYQWTWKVDGKTRTIRLSEEQARLCEVWIQNHRRLREIVREMEQFSLIETDKAIAAISRS